MHDSPSIDLTLQTLSRHPFRAKFHLRGRDAATVQLRGMEVIRGHAAEPVLSGVFGVLRVGAFCAVVAGAIMLASSDPAPRDGPGGD